jgi:hypothetical protein
VAEINKNKQQSVEAVQQLRMELDQWGANLRSSIRQDVADAGGMMPPPRNRRSRRWRKRSRKRTDGGQEGCGGMEIGGWGIAA